MKKYEWLKGWVKELEPGEAFVATRGLEFDCTPASFAGSVYRYAEDKGWKATVVCFQATVVFAFYSPQSFLRPNMKAYPIVKKYRGEGA